MNLELDTSPAAAGDFAAKPSSAGSMSALIGSFDWAATPLGLRERWPQSLR